MTAHIAGLTNMPTPSARQFYLALLATIATGESHRVGSITLSPRTEWPTSDTALWGLALDMARAEQEGVAA